MHNSRVGSDGGSPVLENGIHILSLAVITQCDIEIQILYKEGGIMW